MPARLYLTLYWRSISQVRLTATSSRYSSPMQAAYSGCTAAGAVSAYTPAARRGREGRGAAFRAPACSGGPAHRAMRFAKRSMVTPLATPLRHT